MSFLMQDNHFSSSTDRLPHRLAHRPPSLFTSDVIAASYPAPTTDASQRLSSLVMVPSQPLHSAAGEVTRRNTVSTTAEHVEFVGHTTTTTTNTTGANVVSATTTPAFRLTRPRVRNGDVDAKHHGIIDSLLFRFAPVGVRRALRTRKRGVVAAGLAVLLLALFVFFDGVYDLLLTFSSRPASVAAAEVWGVEEFDAPRGALAVLVQHTDAMTRLNITLQEECAIGSMLFCNGIRLSPQLLPSWTLHTVEPDCTTCTDAQTYTAAIPRGTKLSDEHAVFATSSAPLGRIGPMLFAMSSVTDDVDVATELPRWSWLRHVYADFTRNADVAVPAAVMPYLAVMGVLSTDQRGRDVLRDAQRATWMSSQEVARSENGFDGALLPLFLFSATDAADETETTLRGKSAKVLNDNRKGNSTLSPYVYVNASSIAPTMREFEGATQARMAAMDNEESVRYTHRRVQLHPRWRIENVPTAVENGAEREDEPDDADVDKDKWQSPCAQIVTTTVDENVALASLTALSAAIGTDVTPAFVAGAQHICHASAALWSEALTHRNVIWIDMLTHRPGASRTREGDAKTTDLSVEVGMSQKLILWLEYAYHAFPHVPYILKGEDDTYMKVPQFLRDLRFVVMDALLLPHDLSSNAYVKVPVLNATELLTAAATALPHLKNARKTKKKSISVSSTRALQAAVAAVPMSDMPCLYWGSLRQYQNVRYAAGMLLAVHRHMVHAVLSPSLRRRGVDVVRLATHTYHSQNTKAYRKSVFHRGDVLLGLLLNASRASSQKLCAGGRVYFMREGTRRFTTLHAGKPQDVTWSTVAAHPCRAADQYYLHYFFRKEHTFALTVSAAQRGAEAKTAAFMQARQWVAEQEKEMPPAVGNWSDLPVTTWTRRPKEAPLHDVAEQHDSVAVYHSTLHRYQHLRTRVSYGYYADPST